MRVLFVATRGAGHLGPLLPFARAIVAAGHEAVVAVPESGAGVVRGEGLAARPVADPPSEQTRAVFARVRRLSDARERNVVVLRELLGRVHARAALPGLIAAVEEWAPDVVVRATSAYAGALAAEARGVPCVRVAVGLTGAEGAARRLVAGALSELRAERGLAPDPAGDALAGGPLLTLVPASLEDHDGVAPATAHRFRDADGPVPRSADKAAPREPPLVYLSFGSVAPALGLYPEVYRAALAALGPLGVRVLVSVGADSDPAALGAVSSGVRVERWVSQPRALAQAAVMVCHGGLGSVLGALAIGVPLVVVPLFADQPRNARRVAAVGAGLALDGGAPALGGLGDAVRRVLAEPRFSTRAREVGKEIAAQPPAGEALGLIEAAAAA